MQATEYGLFLAGGQNHMKIWAELLELVTMVLITFAVIIGAGLLVGYLLVRLLGAL